MNIFVDVRLEEGQCTSIGYGLILVGYGLTRSDYGPVLTHFGSFRSNFGQILTHFGSFRSNFGSKSRAYPTKVEQAQSEAPIWGT